MGNYDSAASNFPEGDLWTTETPYSFVLSAEQTISGRTNPEDDNHNYGTRRRWYLQFAYWNSLSDLSLGENHRIHDRQ